jgi:plasmid stabilization system protein ParE
MNIFISERARKDLLQINSYIGERNQLAADNFIEAIDDKFEQFSLFPFIGRERTSLANGLRSILVRTHLIFYAVERERIVIVRVGRMDVDEEFER